MGRMYFRDRTDAGKQLAAALLRLRPERPVVLALPRGGVPVAYEVAAALDAPLDVLVARKLGAPSQPEFGFGAIAPDALYLDPHTVRMLRLGDAEIEEIVGRESRELERRERAYRNGRPPADVSGRTVILVDDGLATGVTMRAAIRSVKARNPGRIVVAVPVGAPETVQEIELEVSEIICLNQPWDFSAVGVWYEDFRQTEDQEVIELLEKAPRGQPQPPAQGAGGIAGYDVTIPAGGHVILPGNLHVPAAAVGVVAFAHGSGSSRFSTRNRYVARVLQDAGVATLLFDLLTAEEEEEDRYTAHLRFDIDLLSERLLAAVNWLDQDVRTSGLPVGLFGASTGGAAAIRAAAEDERVKAVVSRGGRPDLAGNALERILAPTLLLVGENDPVVLELNEAAFATMRAHKRLTLIPRATHLFEEPGTLEQAAAAARDWFVRHLEAPSPEVRPGRAPGREARE